MEKILILACFFIIGTLNVVATEHDQSGKHQVLTENWLLKSSVLVPENGERISTTDYKPKEWLRISVPTTVLNALVKNGIYPDPRIGLNLYRIPDSSDEFNKKNDLQKFSYLPDKRNPWRDPYWYRTEFTLPEIESGKHLWLNFKGINYRAEVWINGNKVSDPKEMVGIYRRFRLDITGHANPGKNCLAVKIYPVDHPGLVETQLEPFVRNRGYNTDIKKDVTFVVSVGYDCMGHIPDRNMGIWQDVFIDFTGPVDIRDPFVVTDLPLPDTSKAYLTISADLINATQKPQKCICRGVIRDTGIEFAREIVLAGGETRQIVFSPTEFSQLEMVNPRLWWPKNYGSQNLYNLLLSFEVDGRVSDTELIAFGIREVSGKLSWHRTGAQTELYWKGSPGLQVHINGQKVFSQGGWLQPEILFDMPAKRMETEVRYLTGANLNTVTFEDLPVPNDEFLEACDKYGLLYWTCFYSTWWLQPPNNMPDDKELLAACGVDIIKRYRNHPSMILYSCCGEGEPNKEVYLTWRRNLLALDTTRLFIPTVDVHEPFEWLRQELPTGIHDDRTFKWVEPARYYEMVRGGGTWMFNTEAALPTYPPISNLRKFIPDCFASIEGSPAPAPVDETWAHHDATHFSMYLDEGIRRMFGPPSDILDYIWESTLISANHHRAWSEAVNHRMWDITSGVWEWKINSSWPSVAWQMYDWYLKPLSTYFFYKSAFEPLHIQLSPLDGMVTLVNRRLHPEKNLEVSIKIYNSQMKVIWENQTRSDVGANTYQDVFSVPSIIPLTTVYFAKLILKKGGELVSENFYWLTASHPTDWNDLHKLPMVKLNTDLRIEIQGEKQSLRVKLENPTDQLAFFIQLALTKGPKDEEVLPFFWEDNYFSLLPHESREITGTFGAEEMGNTTPVLEVGGWNIQTDYKCEYLKPSSNIVNLGENFTLTAGILDTFLDGSRTQLLMDNKPVATRWAWNRGGKSNEITFNLSPTVLGKHVFTIANKSVMIEVR
jgi:hypothetical protein